MSDDPDLDSAYALETPDDNLRLYRTWAETYDATFVDAAEYRLPGLVVRQFLAKSGQGPVLDVGCGTGAVGQALPDELDVHGLDLSPDMLVVAAEKDRYSHLILANLKEPLLIEDATYNGVLSSGTFTHGHVGAEALPEIARIMAPGALAVVSIRDAVWDTLGFDAGFAELVASRVISVPERVVENIYGSPEAAPDGHAEDVAFITSFERL